MPFGIRLKFALVCLGIGARARCLFVMFLAFVGVACALDRGKSMSQYAHRIWGQEEGLFQPTIYSILQTRDGFLWLGTQDSLIRFDGVHFREFAEGNSPLRGSLIRALVEDDAGNLWAGSLGSGILRIAHDGAVQHYSIANGLPSNAVFCLVPDKKGAIWACTTEGLVHIENGHLHVLSKTDGLSSNRIRTACVASDGTLWLAGLDSGLSHWTGSRSVPFSSPQLAPDSTITALECSAPHNLWVGTAHGLVHVGQFSGKSTNRLYTTADGLPDNEISALTQSPDGTVWVGTNDGVSRLRNGEISAYRTRDGLSHSEVLSLCLDREGTLWAGTKNGLDQFTDGKVTPFTTSEGLITDDVGPVLEDTAGHLWIGTLGRGLSEFDGQHFRVISRRNGLLSNTVLSLAADPSGDLWVGTKAGVNRWHEGKIVASYGPASGLGGQPIRSLFVDKDGTLWAGTGAGLMRLAGTRFTPVSATAQPEHAAVLALTGGQTVSLFASLEGVGLYVLRNNQIALQSLDTTHAVDCLWLDKRRHTLWMGTLGSGLLRWRNGVFSHVYVRDGLYDNRIYSILPDDRGNLWFASSKGIFRLAEQELDDFTDGKRKGVTSLPFTTGQLRFECRAGVQPAACRTKDGRLWFSTTNGLVVLDPNHLLENPAPPPANITTLVINGKRFRSDAFVRIKPGEANNIEILYAGLSFISPEKVRFRYKLEGHDRSWVDAGERREAFYTNLPPGHFKFLVEARNADGVWSKRAASASFLVEPRLYQHWWFFPLLALGISLLILLGLRIRIRQLRERFRLVLAERNRIARELHDTLLQGLSGITMEMQALWTKLPPSPEKQMLADIIKDAGKCSAEARQSLWGLRGGGSPSGLLFSEKLKKLAHQAVEGRHIALSLGIEDVSLSEYPDAEYQLLRIAQEAMANTLQHAGALWLSVSLRHTDEFVLLTVEDDGVGFSSASTEQAGHFGMQAMRERATEIGAELLVVSSSQSGTRITTTLPLTRRLQPESNLPAHDMHQT